MKVSVRQQQLLLQLQATDDHIRRLRKHIRELPQTQLLAQLDEDAAFVKEQFMQHQRKLDALKADISRLEHDIETVRARLHLDNDKLLKSTTPKEATALQSEIETLNVRKSELEDREIQLLQEQEDVEAKFTVIEAEWSQTAQKRELLNSELMRARDQLESELRQVVNDRALLAAEVSGDVLAVYTQLSEKYGVAVARLRAGVSEASNMQLAPSELSAIHETPSDELVFCPQSGAILVRDFED